MESHTSWPGPGPRGRGRRGPPRHAVPGGAPAVLRAGSGSVLLLLLFRCGRGEPVLNPEALHEEVDDGAVQVLVQGGAVEVMAFVRVDLRGRREQVTRRRGGRPPDPARPGPCARLGGSPRNGSPNPLLLWEALPGPGGAQCTGGTRSDSATLCSPDSVPSGLRLQQGRV